MARVSTYLNFPRSTEQAFAFYGRVFGTEPTGIMRFGDMPPGGPPLAEADRDLVMHMELPILGGHVLMGTDAPESMGFQLVQGDAVHVMLEPDTVDEGRRLFDALADGGTVKMPFQQMFWGAWYGQLVDRFGTGWMVNVPG